jgi:hypothetical protein
MTALKETVYGGSIAQPEWLPIIDIARNTDWEMLGLSISRGEGRVPLQVLRCKCGRFKAVQETILRRNPSKSCFECRGESPYSTINNKRLYSIYRCMIDRCQNNKNEFYHIYGGRGIEVCKVWIDSFKEFSKWSLMNGYSANLTIDREDNDGNYEPCNCRWATMKEQNNNRRNNVMLTLNGKKQSLMAWALETGLTRATIYLRINRGWSVEQALTTKMSKRHKARSP